MKKLALLLAMVMLLVCVLASCNGTTEESKGDTSAAVSDTAEDSKEPEESKEPVDDSKDESEESEEPAGPTYAEGTTEIDRTLEATSVTVGRDTNELVSTRGEEDKWAPLTYEKDGETYNKLTDGVKSDNGGEVTDFFGTQPTASLEVIVDLGEIIDGLADFSVWTATCESWGISVADSVQFFVSDDGENWLPIADPILGADVEVVDGKGEWKLHEFKCELEMGVSAQYVKFVINKAGHIWLGEVNVDIYE